MGKQAPLFSLCIIVYFIYDDIDKFYFKLKLIFDVWDSNLFGINIY